MHRSTPISMKPRTALARAGAVLTALTAAVALAGCGSSLDTAFVDETGEHSTQLEKVYVLYGKDVLGEVSSRDLKDINAALAANDLKKATPGDLRRAQSSINSRIKKLDSFVRQIRTENNKLKKMELPDFKKNLDDDVNSTEFAEAYEQTTKLIEDYTTRDIAAAKVVFTSLERYLDFLEQWEEYLTDDDTSGLVDAGEASDAALEKMNKASDRLKARGTLNSKLDPEVDKLALAASNSDQLADLVREVREKYPDSFLAKHVVEKK